MTAVARMTVLVMRTVAPYRTQGLVVFGVIVLIDSRSLVGLLPALALLLAPLVAAQPFLVADKETCRRCTPSCPCPAARCPGQRQQRYQAPTVERHVLGLREESGQGRTRVHDLSHFGVDRGRVEFGRHLGPSQRPRPA